MNEHQKETKESMLKRLFTEYSPISCIIDDFNEFFPDETGLKISIEFKQYPDEDDENGNNVVWSSSTEIIEDEPLYPLEPSADELEHDPENDIEPDPIIHDQNTKGLLP